MWKEGSPERAEQRGKSYNKEGKCPKVVYLQRGDGCMRSKQVARGKYSAGPNPLALSRIAQCSLLRSTSSHIVAHRRHPDQQPACIEPVHPFVLLRQMAGLLLRFGAQTPSKYIGGAVHMANP